MFARQLIATPTCVVKRTKLRTRRKELVGSSSWCWGVQFSGIRCCRRECARKTSMRRTRTSYGFGDWKSFLNMFVHSSTTSVSSLNDTDAPR
eukprot:3743383-Rhodomonas_salina.5